MEALKILFLEDNRFDVELIQRTLKRSDLNFVPEIATDEETFIQSLYNFKPDLILSDHSLPQFDSLSALRITKEQYPNLPFILVTGSVSEEFAVTCIKNGAENYILKDNLIRLPSLIENAIKKRELKSENEEIKRLNEQLQHTQDVLTEKNKSITDSIRYAKKIQSSVLPETKTFYKIFPESFILYKPKDIISGDFYWFSQINETLFIAVGDCTGHGVPGAMLSMMGYHLLNEIVHLKNITEPSAILDELNRRICKIFKQGEKNAINDGMDIAFCTFNKNTMMLNYAGAKRPVYIINKGTLTEIKSSPFPIGGIQDEKPKYTSNKLQLEKGDKVYLFTDGYIDQFGGEKNKKIKSKRFKQLVEKMYPINMGLQKKIINSFIEEWRGNMEQTDDVLIIGVEI